jgi:hypothetical protein
LLLRTVSCHVLEFDKVYGDLVGDIFKFCARPKQNDFL